MYRFWEIVDEERCILTWTGPQHTYPRRNPESLRSMTEVPFCPVETGTTPAKK